MKGPAPRRGLDPRLFLACCCAVIAGALHVAIAVRTFDRSTVYAVIGVVAGLSLATWSVAAYRNQSSGVLRVGAGLFAVIAGAWISNRLLAGPRGPDAGHRWNV